MTKRYKATIAYDGRAYAGWQVQPGQRTIQSECEKSIKHITGESTRLHASGRTDSGVHARAQVAHFDLATPKDPRRMALGFNAILDGDIRFMEIEPVSSEFHARFSATRKEYRYFIWNGRIVPPHIRFYRSQYSRPLNAERMQAAARQLAGRHDFGAFASSRGYSEEDTVRNLLRLEVEQKGNEFTIIAESEGFLYKMVRSLTGFLIRIGTGRIDIDETKRILESRKRSALVPSAEAKGLFLWKVYYKKKE